MNRRQPRYKKGDRIGGRFLVHQALMGGMGEVYLCLDELQMIPLALKTFQDGSNDLADIFQREVASWIALEKHPNIVRCFMMEKYDNIPFMQLEWVAGEESKGTDLRSWLRHGPLDLTLALRFTVDIVRGLMHANAKVPGIVHRDLKPNNVLVNQSQQAKITDFGLALVAQIAKLNVDTGGDEGELGHSRFVGSVVGTPPYMPPEQWRGESDLDFRTDLYAVGCILFELLTGRWPYTGRTLSELRAQHLEAPLPPLDRDFPPAVQHILDGCLAKQRADRFERLDILLDAMKQVYKAYSGENLPEVSTEGFTTIDYNNRGLTFRNLGQPQRAIADYDQALRLDPNNARAWSNRGNCYGILGQEERAIADYDQALRLDPTLAPPYMNRGLSFSHLGQEEQAIADYDQALRLDPSYAPAYYNRGLSFSNQGKQEQAIADFDQALHFDPTFALAYMYRGNCYSALGQEERAIADFDQALHFDSKLVRAYINRAGCYAKLGKQERAIEDLDRGIHLDPTVAHAYSIRGASYAKLGQYQRALTDYDQAVRLNPTSALVHMARGNYFSELGQYQRALTDYDQAIRLDPTYSPAYSNRGISYIKLGQPEQALADFDQALSRDANDAYAWFNKGGTLAGIGRLQDALLCFEKADSLGFMQAAGAIQRARRELGLPPMQLQNNSNDPESAFNGFQQASSLEEMQKAVQQFPILVQMISMIEQVIQQEVPPQLKREFEIRLAWLKQIVRGE